MVDLLSNLERSLVPQKVGIEEFAESSDYCGKTLYPGQLLMLKLFFLEELTGEEEDTLDYWISGGRTGSEVAVCPNIREKIAYLRDRNYDHFSEVVLVAGRRGSKGLVTGISMAKVMFDILSMDDPHRTLGIDVDKEIQFPCIAASETQAKINQYADFVSTIEGCAAFDKYVQKSLELEFKVATEADLRRMTAEASKGRNLQRDTSKLRGMALAANSNTLRGIAAMASCMDEMAFMANGDDKSSASSVYKALKPSLDQFGRYAMMFCNSSPASKVGEFYDRHVEAMKPFDPNKMPGEDDNGTPLNFGIEFPSWLLYEGYKKSKHYPKKIKKVIQASPDWDPNELDEDGSPLYSEDDKLAIIAAKAMEAANPESYKVERRGKFAEVVDSYLNPDMVDRVFKGIPAGYSPEGIEILQPISANYGMGASNRFQYVAHLDPSSTTAGFGFALGHIEEFEDRYGEMQKHVVFDIIKRWDPNHFPGKTIKWETVTKEVLGYIDIFRPYYVTFDQFQSHAPIQELRQKSQDLGISHVIIEEIFATGEKNWNRAEVFKTAINHGLVHAPMIEEHPDVELASDELKFLQIIRSTGRFPRVDKQDIGPVRTKDMADCMMVVVETLIGNVIAQQVRERAAKAVASFGSQGGYRLGGHEMGAQAHRQSNPAFAEAMGALAGGRRGEQSLPGGGRVPWRAAIGGQSARGINRVGRQRRSR